MPTVVQNATGRDTSGSTDLVRERQRAGAGAREREREREINKAEYIAECSRVSHIVDGGRTHDETLARGFPRARALSAVEGYISIDIYVHTCTARRRAKLSTGSYFPVRHRVVVLVWSSRTVRDSLPTPLHGQPRHRGSHAFRILSNPSASRFLCSLILHTYT